MSDVKNHPRLFDIRHPTSHIRHDLRGFTLVELLVVVSIIALLLAILLPALNKARDAAKVVRCQSNQRQIGLAAQAYINDNDGHSVSLYIWPYGIAAADGDPKHAWAWALWGYMYSPDSYKVPNNDLDFNNGPDRNVFACPSRVRPPQLLPLSGQSASGAGGYSYGLNDSAAAVHSSYKTNTNPFQRENYAAVLKVSKLFSAGGSAMMLEAAGLSADAWQYQYTWGLAPHNDATTVAFFDGHVTLEDYDRIPLWLTQNFKDPLLPVFWGGRN